mmetsp:Transcript_10986/g.16987  ORF Transcript_10986/g.16987 Transcript_10986/m.16987 type:complete len:297 (+) Transcript_10986:33-923(+)
MTTTTAKPRSSDNKMDTDKNDRKRPHPDDDDHEKEKQDQEKLPITAEGEMPQKKFYRSRAHCNPLSHNDAFEYPRTPKDIDWTEQHYPNLEENNTIQAPNVLDVGCGFGGLTLALATLLPKDLILGMEIRAKVTEYVRLRIAACRKESPGQYQNCSVLRSNSMKYLVNFFAKSSIDKIFFCFPDPHFKKKNHGRRIISNILLTEYAYVLKPGIGKLYCITDVKELHEWHVAKCDAHPMFERITGKDLEEDPCVGAMKVETEEGKKVERAGSEKYYALYRRINNEEVPYVDAEDFFS